MDEKVLKEKIALVNKKMDIVKKLIKNEKEPYKTEALKVIYAKFLNDELSVDIPSEPTRKPLPHHGEINPIGKLAKYCEISENKMRNVLDYENGKFTILKKSIGDSIAEKQVNASLCILTAWEIGMNIHWRKVTELTSSLRDIHIDIKHLGENLTTRKDYFSTKGKLLGTRYHITTKGIEKGVELLKSLI